MIIGGLPITFAIWYILLITVLMAIFNTRASRERTHFPVPAVESSALLPLYRRYSCIQPADICHKACNKAFESRFSASPLFDTYIDKIYTS
jgi:hypothetical protein